MTTTPRPNRFGKLEPVEPRSCWPDEARDLTPWIATEEGLKLLGEAVGLDLACESCEVSVGPFSADILARDISSNGLVIIENQLERTNHDHFGKTLTYAAVLDANTAIWIARSFTDEHRKAIEWLNEKTKGDLLLFAVELQVWRIGASEPAPRFEVVAGPNEAVQEALTERDAKLRSPLDELYLAFFTEVRELLLKTGEWQTLMKPQVKHWMNITLGRSWAHLTVSASAENKTVDLRLYLRHRYALAVLDKLLPMKTEIEQEIGQPLEWNPNPKAQDKVVRLRRQGDITDRTQWNELANWLATNAVRFKHTFRPRILAMDVSGEEAVAGV